MSGSAGRILGAAAGFALAGPLGVSALTAVQVGWTIGSLVDGPQGPDVHGPRLNDLQVQLSTYGKPIPIVYGTMRIAGNIIWAKPIKETANEEEVGKGGGPTSTTYTYSADFAVGLCEGEIAGVHRIWANGDLLYNAGNDATLEEIIASNQAADSITFYTGSETQTADPLIQAHKGAANTPAFRGLAYVVFDDLQLEKYGNSIPNLTFEVVSDETVSTRLVRELDTPDTTTSSLSAASTYLCGENGEAVIFIESAASSSSYEVWVVEADGSQNKTYNVSIDSLFTFFGIAGGHGDQPALIAASGASAPGFPESFVVYLPNPYDMATAGPFYYTFEGTGLGEDPTARTEASAFQVRDGKLYALTTTQATAELGLFSSDLSAPNDSGSPQPMTLLNSENGDLPSTSSAFLVSDENIYVLGGDDKIYVLNMDGVLESTITFTPTTSVSYQFWAAAKCWLFEDDGSLFIYDATDKIHRIELNGDYSYVGTPAPGATSGNDSFLIKDGVLHIYDPVIGNDKLYAYQLYSKADSASTTVKSIVDDLLDRAGLDAAEYTTTSLTDPVHGYIVSRPMSARAAIEPLQQAYTFDAAEKDGKIVFVKRGGASGLSIPEDDLGATDSDSVELITTVRQQEYELPSEVVVNYIDQDRDYQQGAQHAQRINTIQKNVATIQLPIAMTASKAKQISEKILYNAWVEREKFSFQLTNNYIAINPTDVITVTANGVGRIMRITRVRYDAIMQVDCVSEDSQVYISTAVAGTSQTVAQQLKLPGNTNLAILDAPMLRNADNDLGLYLAASGYATGWSGAEVFKSLDGGASYLGVEALISGATMGVSNGALADHSSTVWDTTSSVTVRLNSGSLSSSTEELVLNGANYAILGSEVLQFVNATLNADGSYTLDTFLRGRRGTEWATGTHSADDVFVLLVESDMGRIDAQLNIERHYKGVSFNTLVDSAYAKTATNTGVSLKPFSPTFIQGSRDGSNNLTITWLRRSRYIGSGLSTLPLFEESEVYKVEILDAPGGNVLRTLTNPTSESAAYSATDQTNDGLTPGDPVYVRIYQISATVGDGYPSEATV